MSRVRNRDTAPEQTLRRGLIEAGLRGYRLHRADVPGTPDVAWIGRRVAVFIDGAFWHGRSAFKKGQSGTFWDEKISKNIQRDRQVDTDLTKLGRRVVRIWDFEMAESLERCVQRVIDALAEQESLA